MEICSFNWFRFGNFGSNIIVDICFQDYGRLANSFPEPIVFFDRSVHSASNGVLESFWGSLDLENCGGEFLPSTFVLHAKVMEMTFSGSDSEVFQIASGVL